jgi:hypothetical protein
MRMLTHKLKCVAGIWRCRCGYVLGTGHEKLYEKCRLALSVAAENEAKLRPKKVTHVFPDETDTKAVVELFDFALKPRKKKTKGKRNANSKRKR